MKQARLTGLGETRCSGERHVCDPRGTREAEAIEDLKKVQHGWRVESEMWRQMRGDEVGDIVGRSHGELRAVGPLEDARRGPRHSGLHVANNHLAAGGEWVEARLGQGAD